MPVVQGYFYRRSPYHPWVGLFKSFHLAKWVEQICPAVDIWDTEMRKEDLLIELLLVTDHLKNSIDEGQYYWEDRICPYDRLLFYRYNLHHLFLRSLKPDKVPPRLAAHDTYSDQ